MKKSLSKNSLYNVVYRFLNIIYPLIAEAYIARVLKPEGVGRVALALTIVTYFTTVAALGLPNYGVRIIGGSQNSINARNKAFSELFTINIISTFVCFILYNISLIFFAEIADLKILRIFSFVLLANLINIDWLYQGMEEYGYIAGRTLAIKFVSLIFLFLFVKTNKDTDKYAMILCFATCGNYILNVINAKKHVSFSFKDIEIKKHLKPLFYLLFASLATEIYTLLDSTMVGTVCSESDLAYYTNASRLVRTIFNILTAMCGVFLPRLSLLKNEGRSDEYESMVNLGIRIALFFAIPGMIGVFILSKPLILLLYGELFLPSVYALRILCVLILVFSVAYTSGHIVLISFGAEKEILKATVIGAITNFLLNLFLIRIWGYLGASVASVIAEIMVTLFLVKETIKRIHIYIDFSYWKSMLCSTLIMMIVVISLYSMQLGVVFKILLCVGSGAFVYIFFNILLKNSICIMFINKVKNIIKK